MFILPHSFSLPFSPSSNILSLALDIQLHQLNIPITNIGDLFLQLINLHHQLLKNLCPLLVFSEVFLLLLVVFCHDLGVFLFPLLELVVDDGGFFVGLFLEL